MEENKKKIEEQQKKMVSHIISFVCNESSMFLFSGWGKTEDDWGADEDREREAEAEEERGEGIEERAEGDPGQG